MKLQKESKFSNPIIMGLLASFCCLLWGSAAVVIKLGYGYFGITGEQVPTILLFAGCRFGLGGLLLFVLLGIREKQIICPRTRKGWLNLLLVGVVMIFLQYMFNFIGVANASGVNASVLNGVGNMFSILLACTVFRQEKLTARKMIGCALGIGGLLLMNLVGNRLGTFHFMGEGFLIIASVCGGCGNCLVRIYSKDENPFAIAVYQLLFGGSILALLGYLLGGRLDFSVLPGVLCILYLAVLSAVVYFIWNQLLKYNDVSKVSIYGFLIPIFGVFLSAILLGETQQAFQLTTWITLVLVCLSIIIVSKKDS